MSPQEVVVPVCVMARSGAKIEQMVETWPSAPNWWEEVHPVAPVGQGALFKPAREAESEPRLQWLDALVRSPAYKAQKTLAGRGAPSDSEVRQLIGVLVARNGK